MLSLIFKVKIEKILYLWLNKFMYVRCNFCVLGKY